MAWTLGAVPGRENTLVALDGSTQQGNGYVSDERFSVLTADVLVLQI